ncbi:3-oxoacyl-[acyl-carrier protein] reductase [Lentzea albidocapillata subsp. violacea]|uniref:3-oxoacyl-[acyl-carrier protein] reductase n=1 Tax=Lentzea albidocapillata subsp. violacea TaxID=128104 RepID=A0A1G9LRE1_9PSEU|nr:SDR family oxidoreductase [Lentzea albidocapillata]SDL64516.1 3-oxoacyl-[acyl-carrier protein] reductase [Lentzea albidocapillata subsp. violacea]
MWTDLAGKVVLVTGSSSGIGRATAQAYAADGARVAITYHENKDGAEETARLVREAGGTPLVVRYDLNDEVSIREAITAVTGAWGGIDVLVTNAVVWSEGIPRPGREVPDFEDTDPRLWQEVLRTTVDATFHTIQAALPAMRDRPWGRIVMVSSGLADYGMRGGAAYGAAKAGLLGIARSLAWEVGADDVLVNVVTPGQTMTENVRRIAPAKALEAKAKTLPSGRLSVPEDVANAIVFLGSAANGNITGQTLRVTGGS